MAYAAELTEGGYSLIEVVKTRVFFTCDFRDDWYTGGFGGGYGSVLDEHI